MSGNEKFDQGGPEYDNVNGGLNKLLDLLENMSLLPGAPLSMLVGEKKILGIAYGRVMLQVEEQGCLLELAIRVNDGEVSLEGSFGAKRYLGTGNVSEETLRSIFDKVAEGAK
jgi:hypothetical protein